MSRHFVQTLFAGNIGQHGVVENIGGGVTDSGGGKDYKKRQPGADKAKKDAAERAYGNKTGPDPFLVILGIRNRSAYRPNESDRNRGGGGGITPVSQIVNGGNACALGQIIKIQGYHGGDHKDKGGIAYII